MKYILAILAFLLITSPVFAIDSTDVEMVQLIGSNVGVIDKSGDKLGIDVSVSGAQVIDILHHEIHEGEAWELDLTDLALADDASIGILLTVGSGVEAHIEVAATAGGDAELFIYEQPTVVAIGTNLVPINLNRSINATSASTASYGVTVSDYGTTIADRIIAGGTKSFSSGGGGGSREETILRNGYQYFIRLENEGGAAKVAGLHLVWYEED